ncbi:MAG: hypothetical protein Q8N99_04175 [Nanoarchaeota archaeon]|nr:hypothetical protein [Nanoarchaeota archaeon]
MPYKKLPKLDFSPNMKYSEKIKSNIEVVVRKQEDIDKYQKTIGHRKARMKRYGKSATERIKNKSKKK